jgi:hypothetical protein
MSFLRTLLHGISYGALGDNWDVKILKYISSRLLRCYGFTMSCEAGRVYLTQSAMYEGVSKSFRTGRLERELQMVQLSATRCSCIAIL